MDKKQYTSNIQIIGDVELAKQGLTEKFKNAGDRMEGESINKTDDGNEPKENEKSELYEPVPFYKLFRYATCSELFLVFCGIIMSIITGTGMPIFAVLYSELTSMYVTRSSDNTNSRPTLFLQLFGGGRILVNASKEERYDALMEDSVAFGISAFTANLVQFIIGAAAIAILNYTAQKQIVRVRRLFLQSVLRQDISWYDVTNTANFASRLTQDLDKMQDGIGEKISIFVHLTSISIFCTVMSFMKGWKLTLAAIICASLIIVAQAIVAKVQSSLTQQELESYGDAGAVAEEVLSSIRTVVAFGGEEKEVMRFSDKLKKATSTGIKRGVISGFGDGFTWFITYSIYAIIFWYGVKLILESRKYGIEEYLPETLVFVLICVVTGASNIGQASSYLDAFAAAKGAAAAVFSVISRVPQIDSLDTNGMKPGTIHGDIHLQNIHFQYPARPNVKILKGLNITVRSGETVALVGRSGCGKTTTLELVQRLYDPSQGQVLLDGMDVKQLNVGWLRSKISVVGQEPVLFGTTIKQNILFGRMDATQLEIEEAAREANAHDFISKLPQGYDTMVGERGAQLSGGQKQRIAIARALIRKPNILLLDEATSALDLHSEAKVQAALEKAAKGRTTLIVTHRLSTVRNADRIVFIADGQVVEEGSHNELMTLQGHYYALVKDDPTLTKGRPTENAGTKHLENENITEKLQASQKIPVLPEKDQEDGYDVSITRIMALNKPECLYCIVGCITATLNGAMYPVIAILFGEILGVLSEEDPEPLESGANYYSLLFLVAGIVLAIGTFLQMYCFGFAGVQLTHRLRILVFSSMLRQEIGWYDDEENSVGVLCARLSGDAASVQGATGSIIGVILQSTSVVGLGLIVSFLRSWKVTLVSTICIPLVLSAVLFEEKILHSQGLHEKSALEAATKIAVEAISNIRTVATLCGEQLFLERYMRELRIAHVAARKKTQFRGLVFSIGQTAPFFSFALSLCYGGYLICNEGIPYSNVITVSQSLIFGAWMLGRGLSFSPNYSIGKMAAGRMFKLMDRKPRIFSPPNAANKDLVSAGSVKYSEVKFHYPTRKEVPILRGLNLQIKPGQTVALVGPSGCGKSTCIQLLQRFYEPTLGRIELDEKDISSLPLKRLRAQLGIVSQEPVLFDRTIAENIAYGDNSRSVPNEEIIEAAKKSNIHQFITTLPMGYNTRLGVKGTQLSGGQKQRIAIARALVRNPRILLLDEATSALDTYSEKMVQLALDQAREDRTCITIAHRLATVQQADVICVINQGVVAEMGSHEELLEKQGLYCQLLRQAASHVQ